jgi:molybdopterin converting factor subunit 1
MKTTVKFFAALREIIGAGELTLDIPDGQTADGLFRELCTRYPRLAAYDSSLFYSVNAEYVPPDHALKDGDEVAFIPPVSGGGGGD